jgi:hypothetical protein
LRYLSELNPNHQRFIPLLNSLEEKHLRDLLWLLYSPSLLKQHPLSSSNFDHPCLKSTALLQWYEQHKATPFQVPKGSTVLGKYAEYLLHFFLSQQKEIKVLAKGVQLIKDGLTLGELDFLLEDVRQQQFIHLEMAVKYYLKIEHKEKTVFIGPNAKDRLERKLQKLQNHQLLLGQKYPSLLPEHLTGRHYIPKVFLKGALFYPISEWNSLSLAEGWWITINELEQIKQRSWTYVPIEKKQNWIYPFVETFPSYQETELEEVLSMYLDSKNGIMLVRKSPDGKTMDRGFVMGEEWLKNQALTFCKEQD